LEGILGFSRDFGGVLVGSICKLEMRDDHAGMLKIDVERRGTLKTTFMISG
jgi:hypothetical protein